MTTCSPDHSVAKPHDSAATATASITERRAPGPIPRACRPTRISQESHTASESWLVVPVLVHVRGGQYRLDGKWQAAGWFTMSEALSLDLLPGFEPVIAQYRDVIVCTAAIDLT